MQISVAMCTYNGQRFLKEQLQSIAEQSLLPFELVICDDGSSDGTGEIVREFSASAPFSARFIQNDRNLGSTKNFEKAIELCNGELIALCDQDDVWLPEKLEKLSTPLLKDPAAGGVFSNGYLIDNFGTSLGTLLWDEVSFFPRKPMGFVEVNTLIRHSVVTGATLLFRASLRSKLLPLESCWIHDGWIAWMITLHSRLVYLSEPLIQYRLHTSQQVGLALNASLKERLARARKQAGEPQLLLAKQFEALRGYCMDHEPVGFPSLVDDLERKIRHSYQRAGLSSIRPLRVWPIARNVREYHRYSLGFLSMAKDLLR